MCVWGGNAPVCIAGMTLNSVDVSNNVTASVWRGPSIMHRRWGVVCSRLGSDSSLGPAR